MIHARRRSVAPFQHTYIFYLSASRISQHLFTMTSFLFKLEALMWGLACGWVAALQLLGSSHALEHQARAAVLVALWLAALACGPTCPRGWLASLRIADSGAMFCVVCGPLVLSAKALATAGGAGGGGGGNGGASGGARLWITHFWSASACAARCALWLYRPPGGGAPAGSSPIHSSARGLGAALLLAVLAALAPAVLGGRGAAGALHDGTLAHALLVACLHEGAVLLLLRRLPRSFSFGEAAVVAQGVALYLADAAAQLVRATAAARQGDDTSGGVAAALVASGVAPPRALHLLAMQGGLLATVAAAAAVSPLLGKHARTALDAAKCAGDYAAALAVPAATTAATTAAAAGSAAATTIAAKPPLPPRAELSLWLRALVSGFGVLVAWCGATLGADPFSWIGGYMASDRAFAAFLAYWGACLGAFLWAVRGVCARRGLSGIVQRKLFHFLSFVLFAPALQLLPAGMLAFSLGVALGILVILELLRCVAATLVGAAVAEFMGSFLDGRDTGYAILTHIYLLVGCALPIWLEGAEGAAAAAAPTAGRGLDGPSGEQRRVLMTPAIGILALCVVDSLAAVVGSTLGRCRWPGSRKTVEGTAAAVLGLVAVAAAWDAMDPARSFVQKRGGALTLVLNVLAAVLLCVLEAATAQIDNLVLPLFGFALSTALDVQASRF